MSTSKGHHNVLLLLLRFHWLISSAVIYFLTVKSYVFFLPFFVRGQR